MIDSNQLSNPLVLGVVALGLSLLPILLLMVTPFLKLSIVLGALRIGFGSQGVPGPGITGILALVLSLHASSPMLVNLVGDAASMFGSTPPLVVSKGKPIFEKGRGSAQRSETRALGERLAQLFTPLSESLQKQCGAEELRFFRSRARADAPEILILLPAFILSELRCGFTMALSLFIPFLVIDLLVTTVLTGMGMMMVSPTTLAFPLKLLLFVSCDGWLGVTDALLRSSI